MFIVRRPNVVSTPFGGAESQRGLYQSSIIPLLRTEPVGVAFRSINMSPLTG
jgi:hypothetical protein